MIEFLTLFLTDARVFVPVTLIGVPIALLAWAIWKDCKDEGLL
jgi:hypothetical protein